jgi:hypothetical protein
MFFYSWEMVWIHDGGEAGTGSPSDLRNLIREAHGSVGWRGTGI